MNLRPGDPRRQIRREKPPFWNLDVAVPIIYVGLLVVVLCAFYVIFGFLDPYYERQAAERAENTRLRCEAQLGYGRTRSDTIAVVTQSPACWDLIGPEMR